MRPTPVPPSRGGLAAFALAALAPTLAAHASLTPAVQYTFPLSWNGSGTVDDLSPFGNNGKTSGTVTTSTTVPAGLTGKSITTTAGGILTTASGGSVLILSNATLATYGGFSFDTYFRWDGTSSTYATQKILDYAGTESLQLFNPNGANQTANEKVQFALNSATDAANAITMAISANTWYHAVASFNSGTNAVDGSGSLAGTATLSLQPVGGSVTTASLNVTKTNQGDNLIRPIGVGVLGLAGSNVVDFHGLIYNPTAYFGVEPPLTAPDGLDTPVTPEPASLLAACGLAFPLLRRRRRRRR